jgi:hypothetical protein
MTDSPTTPTAEDWERVRSEANRFGGAYKCILDHERRIETLEAQIKSLQQCLSEAAKQITTPEDPPFVHPEPGTGFFDITGFTHKAFVDMVWKAACTVDNGVEFMDLATFRKAAADIREHALRRACVTMECGDSIELLSLPIPCAPPPEPVSDKAGSAGKADNSCTAPPYNCAVRMKLEGKPRPRGSCSACGPMAPKAEQCGAQLAQPPLHLRQIICNAASDAIGSRCAGEVGMAIAAWFRAKGWSGAAKFLEEHL